MLMNVEREDPKVSLHFTDTDELDTLANLLADYACDHPKFAAFVLEQPVLADFMQELEQANEDVQEGAY
jgi:hypothetical protein